MKVAALAALSVLMALPAEAGQHRRQNGSPATTCDNDGHCTTQRATAPITSYRNSRSKTQRTTATKSHALDANGNKTVGVIISLKTGAQARVGISYAARFQAYIDDLETNHGARVLFMGGIRPGRCSSSSEHPCGKALDVCQRRRGVVIRAAICPVALCSVRSPLRTVCSKADAGVIRIMVTPRSA